MIEDVVHLFVTCLRRPLGKCMWPIILAHPVIEVCDEIAHYKFRLSIIQLLFWKEFLMNPPQYELITPALP